MSNRQAFNMVAKSCREHRINYSAALAQKQAFPWESNAKNCTSSVLEKDTIHANEHAQLLKLPKSQRLRVFSKALEVSNLLPILLNVCTSIP